MATEVSGIKQTYTGGCHCGFVKYTVTFDPANSDASRCNCSICHKKGYVSVRVPKEDLKLESPASLDELSDYVYGKKAVHHRFCKTCGVHCLIDGHHGDIVFQGVNGHTIDQDQGFELRNIKLQYWDLKNDNWAQGPATEPCEGGSW
ncbi:hypothetical protein AJ80_05790 [Polytolypa hystricis UAMH7299]|uniref:CENP-V/GFA domain-containing protein n=1 Tax=Polytolypa hystricis (strain UAMH7299) TaxID=1447883 RepID=A0A2B7XZV0_POLH7|nr:hypothetical protein AJ80_05790 [Polytolypa hystricis UAMH7299]